MVIFVSNESESLTEVYFDDLRIHHHKTELIQADDYYPFGLTFNSYTGVATTAQKYKYNGKEEQEETGWLDYGARMYQADLGRWFNVDPLAGEYMQYSPYHYVYNNPLSYIDPDGRKISARQTDKREDENGNVTYTIKFDISISILNNSSSTVSMSELRRQLSADLKEAFSGSFSAGNQTWIFEAGDIDVRNVTSMADVGEEDHLVTLVDDVTGTTTDKDGKKLQVGGKAEMRSLNSYVEPYGGLNSISNKTVHEIGHNANRVHSWDDGDPATSNSKNYMSYDRDCPCEFSGRQLLMIYQNQGQLNQGKNSETAKEDKKVTKTTQLNPDSNVYKGKKVPRSFDD